MTNLKRCTKCHEVKPTEGFAKDPSQSRGLRRRCKRCDALRVQAYYLSHAEDKKAKAKKYERSYSKVRRAKRRGSAQEKARRILRQAVFLGQVKKSITCEDCGVCFAPSRLQGHHPDYLKPLDVVWVCSTCHAKRHRKYAA